MKKRKVIYTLIVCIAFSVCLFGCKKKAKVEPVSSEMLIESESEQISSSEDVSEKVSEKVSEETSDKPSTEDKSEQESEKKQSKETTETPLEGGELGSVPSGYIQSDGTQTPGGYPAVERDGEPIYIDIVNTYWLDEYFGHPDANPSAHVDEFVALAQQIENNPDYDYLVYSNFVNGKHIIFTGEHKGHLCFLLDGECYLCIDKSNNRIYTGEVLNPNTGTSQKQAENSMFYGETDF